MAKSKKRLIVGSVVVVVALCAGVMFMGAEHGDSGEAETAAAEDSRIVVEAENPVRGDIVLTGEFMGTVEPGQQVTVYPKVSGEVLAVNVGVGDTVSAGDVLFQVDSRVLATTIAQTQATIASAQAKTRLNVEMTEKERDTTISNIEDGYDANLINSEAAVRSAENAVRTASATVTSARRALREHRDNEDTYAVAGLNDWETVKDQLNDAVIQAEIGYERAVLALQQAEESYESVKKSYETVEDNYDDAIKMAELNADMSDQMIALRKLQDDLNDYNVKSPISGVIEQCNIDQYDMASPGVASFVISNKEALSISFSVSETAMLQLRVGDAVKVEKNGATSDGKITEISTMVDARTGLFAVKATVEKPGFDMLSGSSVKVFIDTEKVEDGLTVPIDALYFESGAPYLYIADNGVVRKVYVETGLADDDRIQIVSGLGEDDEIITTWNPNLVDGAEITLYGRESEATSSTEEEAA